MLSLALAAIGASRAQAQQVTFPIQLNYNFNGIVHAGEDMLPDDPNGYRSISDRGLDFTAGVHADPLLAPFQLVTTPGSLDIVHLGNRNTVDGGTRAFGAAPDGDDIGIQPNWLTNPDQTGPQSTGISPSIPIAGLSTLNLLYQISNGGGTFDVIVALGSGSTVTATLSGPDWFGGVFPGTGSTDNALADSSLSITEGVIDLSAFEGDSIVGVTFQNSSNPNAGIAILAANASLSLPPARVFPVDLNYNFNGILHAGEAMLPDDPNGYRSISDRGLDFSAGVPADPLLDDFDLVDQAGALDIVHIGNRNTVDGGNRPFDLVADADAFGIQPTWLPNPDQTGPQTTTLNRQILLDGSSFIEVLFQISNGGGAIDMRLDFQGGSSTTFTLSGSDWFGGSLPGVGSTDSGVPSANLNAVSRRIDLSLFTTSVLTAITFENPSNLNAGYAILGVNVAGCISCANAGSVTSAPGASGSGLTLSTSSNGNVGCDFSYVATGATPNTPLAVFTLGVGGPSPLPLSSVFAPCTGTFLVPSAITLPGIVDPFGVSQVEMNSPPRMAVCGATVTAQFVELMVAPCPVLVSDAVIITFGN